MQKKNFHVICLHIKCWETTAACLYAGALRFMDICTQFGHPQIMMRCASFDYIVSVSSFSLTLLVGPFVYLVAVEKQNL